MKLHLNLATRPLDNKRPFLAGAAVAGGAGILALFLLSHAAYQSWRSNRDLRQEISRYQSQIREYRQKQQDLDMFFKNPHAQQVLDRAKFLNSLIGQRSFPWTKVFMDLEKTLPPGVHVVSISPLLKENRAEVKLVIGAANDEGKAKFLQALENSKVFSDIEVTQEEHPVQVNSQDRVKMSLTLWYSTT
jgi:Tfp pilus assembly protein PilN